MIKNVIGLMSGTSADGIDVGMLVTNGESKIKLGPSGYYPFSKSFIKKIKSIFKKKLNINKSKKQKRIIEIENEFTQFNFVAINKFLKKKTGELSSGQKNRISLAKALINDPEILMLDEPTASLDPDTGDFVRSFIEHYSSKTNVTILLASHNMNEVERLCDSVMMMKDGIIVDTGKSQELISRHGRKNLEEVFLKIVRE